MANDHELIRGSIIKWKLAVEFYKSNEKRGRRPGGCSDCPLCLKYHEAMSEGTTSCKDCPIGKDTGKMYCQGTPYELYEEYKDQDSCESMVKYLEGLLERIPK